MVGAGTLALSSPHLLGPVAQPGRRIEIVGDLEVVDVNVDRMLVVVVVDEPPLLDRAEPRLDQRDVGKRVAVERIDERLRVGLAGQIVEEAAGDHHLALDVGRSPERSTNERIGAERLALDERRRHARPLRGHGSRQHLGREDEEPVEIADRRRQHAQRAEHGGRIVGAVVGVEHARRGDRLGAAAARRHLQDEIALGGHGHGDREAARRRDEQPRAVVGDRIVDRGIGIAVLADDGDRRMPPVAVSVSWTFM